MHAHPLVRRFSLALVLLFANAGHAAPGVSATLEGVGVQEPGKPLAAQIVLTNASDKPAESTVEVVVQEDPALTAAQAPDPEYGSDHAMGAKSWTEVEGKTIEEGSLTDGKDWTGASTDWRNDHFAEAFQYVDLGRERKVTRLGWQSGDANWVWNVDVDASTDGKTFVPVAGLKNVDLRKKWGRQLMPAIEPFAARVLRLRYHHDGKRENVIRMPSSLMVYDGVADETWDVPAVGKVLFRANVTVRTPAGGTSSTTAAGDNAPVPTGAYFVAVKVRTGDRTEQIFRHALVLPERPASVSPESRFGMNASEIKYVPELRRLGVGWVRFENMKWPMASAGPDKFRFDGGVAPWYVNHDAIFDAYTKEGISVLPFLFQTATHASSAPANIPEGRKWAYPPRDNASFAEFCFQTVARYGQTPSAPDLLKTNDKKTATGKISTFEIWNEQNLTAPSWGPWVGTNKQYMEMFRAAAEAVKRADPKAKVTNGGYAGIEVETVDELRAITYADGKRPLDFVDVLNVHYYSGRQNPEVATIDTNVHRDAGAKAGLTYEEHLRRLVEWRDTNKPAMPIWLTETGYDTGGPWGTSEQLQAAKLPRVIMMALAAGVEKVFVYREKGSAPSLHAASGVLRDDGTLKPSYFTYATLIRALDGVTLGKRIPHADPNARVYVWKKGDTYIVTAWAVDGTASLAQSLGKCTQTDSFGARQAIEAGDKTPLSIFPIYLSGFADSAAVAALWNVPSK